MKRLAVLLSATSIFAALLLPATAQTQEATDCGVTTLQGTLFVASDGTVECGPPEPIVVPDYNLVPAGAGREATRQELISFASVADLQWADEESPLRGEWADKCMPNSPNSPISNSAFRPQETMVGQIANSHVRAINEIAADGSPVLGQPLDLVLTLGDLADNQQYNEVRYFVDTFDGNKLIDPDSGSEGDLADIHPRLGGDGYDGVQGTDPKGSGVPLPSEAEGGAPVRDEMNPLDDVSLLDLANEPFWAPGLRYPDGSQIPWYALPGNHDVKVQGTIFDDNAAWRALVRQFATGHIKIMELAPDYQSRLCAAIKAQDQAEVQAVMTDIMTNPEQAGTTKVVPSDDERLPIYRSEEAKEDGDNVACAPFHNLQYCDATWVEEQRNTSGLPVGHGYGTEEDEAQARCTDDAGNPLPRLCYSFVQDDFLFIGLDTSPAEGLEGGSIDVPQFEWLERTIRAHSSSYFDEAGTEVTNPGVEDKLVIVYSHHPTSSLRNTGLYSSGEERGFPEAPIAKNGAMLGDDLVNLLTRYPNVIMHSSGHTHRNNVWVHQNEELGTGYYEVNTASVADMPSESRMFEIADNGDGTLSIFSTIIEGAAPPNPRDITWDGDDPTDETLPEFGGLAENSNESWLASFGREVGYLDPQGEVDIARGTPEVRNVELLLPAPFDLSPEPTTIATSLVYTGDTSGKIGKKATAAAQLLDATGSPLSGTTVTFQRGSWSATAITDASGIAATTFKVKGPRGTLPLVASFAGTEIYLPSEVSVPFTVR